MKSSEDILSNGKALRAEAGMRKDTSAAHPLIAAFVAFHLIAILVASVPLNAAPLETLRSFVAPYMRCTGLNEGWDTFAPNPKAAEQYLKAIVITVGGTTEIYSFPRMEELSLLDRYRKERYRKFVESILCGECSGLWPDVERAVARRASNSVDLPDKVILVKFESSIDPRTGAVGDEQHAQPTAISERRIEPEDLR